MTSIQRVLSEYADKDTNGHFRELTVYTRGGKEFTGTLAHWDVVMSSNLIKLTSAKGSVTYVNVQDIEAVCSVDVS